MLEHLAFFVSSLFIIEITSSKNRGPIRFFTTKENELSYYPIIILPTPTCSTVYYSNGALFQKSTKTKLHDSIFDGYGQHSMSRILWAHKNHIDKKIFISNLKYFWIFFSNESSTKSISLLHTFNVLRWLEKRWLISHKSFQKKNYHCLSFFLTFCLEILKNWILIKPTGK